MFKIERGWIMLGQLFCQQNQNFFQETRPTFHPDFIFPWLNFRSSPAKKSREWLSSPNIMRDQTFRTPETPRTINSFNPGAGDLYFPD